MDLSQFFGDFLFICDLREIEDAKRSRRTRIY